MAQPRYQVIERIDAGGMAEVFKANSTSLQGFQKLVAIKRVLPALTQNQRFVRMFLDEAKVSLHLNHTNTVHVFDLGIADGTYFIVMEFVDGTNLKNIIEYMGRTNRRMPVEQAVYIAIEVCKGLTHAHEKTDQSGRHLAIVHRDISPPNVLISRAGEVKITDFGLAKAKSQVEITDPGVVKGKFGYLSPEAAHGEEVDARTDIFAVGIMLWEMLSNRRLFLGESDYDTLHQVRAAKVPSLSKLRPDVPAKLEAVLARALTRDPARRFQTAEEFARALADFLFTYGKVVTSYDVAGLVLASLEQRSARQRNERDVAVDAAVQQELNRIVSLEEIDDLDLFLAQHYESLPDQGGDAVPARDGTFEDPRMWGELGFGADESVETFEQATSSPGISDSGSWQESSLEDLMRPTTPLPGALEGLDAGDPTIEMPGLEALGLDDDGNLAQAVARPPRPAAAAPARPAPPTQAPPPYGQARIPAADIETAEMAAGAYAADAAPAADTAEGAGASGAKRSVLMLVLGSLVLVALLVGAVLFYLNGAA